MILSAWLAIAPRPAIAASRTKVVTVSYCKAPGESPVDASEAAFELGERAVAQALAPVLAQTDLMKKFTVPESNLPAYAFFTLDAMTKAERLGAEKQECLAADVEGKVDLARLRRALRAGVASPQFLWTIQSLWKRQETLAARLESAAEMIEKTEDAAEMAKLIAQKKAVVDRMAATGYFRDSVAEKRPGERPLDMALALDPEYTDAYVRRASAYVAAGQYDKALADCDKALELDPSSPGALVNRAVSARRLGRPGEAMENLAKAIQTKPDYALAYHNLGVAEETGGRAEEALADYKKAAELAPTVAAPWMGVCSTLLSLGRAGEAEPACQKAVELAPASVEAHVNHGIALKLLGNPQEALNELRRAIDADAKNALAYYNRGFAFWALGKKDAARGDWKKACDLGEKLGCRCLQAYR